MILEKKLIVIMPAYNGFGVLATTMKFVLCKMGVNKFKIFDDRGRHLAEGQRNG